MAISVPTRRVVQRNKAFVPLWNDVNRFNVLIGGSGSGKSVSVAQRYVDRYARQPGRNGLIVRKVGRTNRFSTFSLMKNVLNEYGILDRVQVYESDMTIKFPSGNTIIFDGLDNVEKIKSVTFESGPLTDIWLEEASEAALDDYRLLNLRLRGRAAHPFQFTLSLNPINVDHWAKAEFFDNPKPNATCLRTTYLDNRFIDEEYKAELEALKKTDPIRYQVYALGEWGQIGDQAFTNVRFEKCPYGIDDFDRVVFGMDFGFQHYHAIEGMGLKDGRLYSFRELYIRQHTDEKIMPIARPLVPISQRITADSAEPKAIELWRNHGYRVEGAKKGPDSVEAGFRFLRGMEWIIDPDACPGLAAEVRGAAYRKDKNGRVTEEIFSFHDDALAACRYASEELQVPKAEYTMATLNVM